MDKDKLIQVDNVTPEQLMEQFQIEQNKNEIAEVLKELFVEGKINMITDLTPDEIKVATRIYIIADMKGLESWKKGLAFYMKLVLSRNRKSRKEILDAIKGYSSSQGLMSKLNPANWGRRD